MSLMIIGLVLFLGAHLVPVLRGLRGTLVDSLTGFLDELNHLDAYLGRAGLRRIHTSEISDIQPAAIWARNT